MEITLVSSVFPYPKKGVYVGIERHVYEYSKALLKKGHEVNVITTFWNGGKDREEFEGINIYRVSDLSLKFGRLGRLFDLHYYTFSKNILRFERLFKSSEITHALSPIYTANWFKKNEVPLVTQFYHRDELKKISDYLFMPFHYKIEKKSYSLSNAVITPSIASKNVLIEKYKIMENLIYVVPFGVNIEAFGIKKKSEPEEFKDEIVLLFVGPLIPRKGLLSLIKALPIVLEKHKNVKLILVGEGSQKRDLVKEIEKFGIREYVDFTGYLDGWGEKLTRYYKRADIFVFPSLKEGLPQAVIEAMAHRKPVIYSDIPPLVETVGDAGIPVEPKDPKALANAIRVLIDDEELRDELGERGRKRVEENFTWEKVVDQTVRVYEETIGSKRR